MARPRRDGQPPKPTNKRKLTHVYIDKNKTQGLTWDTEQKGLVLQVQASGNKSFKVLYPFHGRLRWYFLASATAIGLSQARELARDIMYEVAKGKDPQAEKRAKRFEGKFAELVDKYRDEYSMKNNRSWAQADKLVRKHLVPYWGQLDPISITRSDVRAALARIKAPIVANQVLASAGAIFNWAIEEEVGGVKENPCRLIKRNKTESRERVLSESEVPKFWGAFDKAGIEGLALKLILLLGQRPGEVIHMRREHIKDGWWEMPGEPIAKLGWPGTKNGANHRIWIPALALKLIDMTGEGFVLAKRGRPVAQLDAEMRTICTDLGITDKATPHDLRRTHGSTITGLGFGRDGMNRVQNHKEGGIGSVYDRHEYADENKTIMEAVASRIMSLVEGRADGNVVAFNKAKGKSKK